jgi:hypothetical protein
VAASIARFVRAGIVPILLAAALAGAGCGADQVSQQASRPTARGDAKDSLFRTANLRRALDLLRRHVGAGATLASFRLEAGAVTSEIEGGAGRSVVVSKRFKLTSVPTPGVTPSGASVALARIDPSAPERIMAQVSARTGVSLGGVDYFLIASDPSSGQTGWVVYLRDGRGSYSADLAGGRVKAFTATPGAAGAPSVPATPTTPAPPTTTPTPPTTVPTPTNPATSPSQSQVQRQIECIARARGESAKIAACLRRQ